MTTSDNFYSILCNQENFLLKGNSYKIKQCLPNARIIFKPAEKDSLDGRPKNGMFISIPREITEYVDDVSPNHWRVQAILLKTPKNKILIINSYFPTDPRVNSFDASDLLSTLSAIGCVIDDNKHDNIIWGGDINADFIRNTFFTKTIKTFIADKGLEKSWEKFKIDFTHVFEKENNTYTSTLDHFLWSEGISKHVTSADVLHLPENTSDHSPIYCIVDIERLYGKSKSRSKVQSRPSWKTSTEEQRAKYRKKLESDMNILTPPHNAEACNDIHCHQHTHIKDIDNYLLDLLDKIDSAAKECLPLTSQKRGRQKTQIANWAVDVEPYKERAMFWHSVWLSAGRPMNTELHKIMKRTRNLYHLQIRKCKRMANILKKNKLIDACLSDKGDIFKEIKHLRQTTPTISSKIDDVSSNIELHFASIYSDLYNSVNDREELISINTRLNERINSSSLKDVERVTPELVREALSHIKSNKTDPLHQYNSDCLKNAPPILCEHLSSLFKMFLTHGYISSTLMISTLIPIIKDKLGDISSSNNYRSIALSSLILKIFDWVFLILYDESLMTDELQFGFQDKTSTNMCTWMVIETIEYYTNNGSEVFACVMDMTKAFDNVKQSILFKQLIERDIPAIVVRLLLDMYMKQQANVRWDNEISKLFPISNGVKQGAVLSPRLYCIYIDELFVKLRTRKTGCWIGDTYCGILGYADDLLLLSPTLDGLQDMINTCTKYAKVHNLTFSVHPNPSKCKTKCLASLKKERKLRKLYLNEKELPWVPSSKHLGCTIEENIHGMKKDLMEKRAIYINKVNELEQEFHFAHPLTKVKINNIFNSYFYGSPTWDLFGEEATRLDKTWNISQRILLGLPRNSHKYFLESLSQTRHINFSLCTRFLRFINSIANSKKETLRNMLMHVKYDCRTITGRNLRTMMRMVKKTSVNDLHQDDFKGCIYQDVPHGEDWKVGFAKELFEVINGEMKVDSFEYAEIKSILKDVVTS